ncbi:galactokinase [Sporomusaceae bacterium BoRhaA]|uniref:galactokinase n=1 Tax=Pelorhabdus rhamnosifermentans TaxID=2772457 RepID=UPI001C0605CD|nr:galactokinase [Pelorhabdus rhamnosifermentans]MBU2701905.1 galactokinase [Pelorhabdus rhamnosifermentans]
MHQVEKCAAVFKEKFHSDRYRVFFAPGRINLIGEHTDYNGGHVFPCSITLGTYVLAQKSSGNLIRMYSMNFPEKGVITFSLRDLDYNKTHDWANYPKGMIRYLIADGYQIDSGMDLLFYGEIPNGAGLSSSASIELATGVMLEKMFALSLERLTLVKLGKKVENQFIGVNCGIMDQFAIGMGKTDCGILLDCDTLKYLYAPLHLKQQHIVIINSNKRRELADSKYNERRNECELALKRLQAKLPIQSLGELDEATFEKNKDLIGDPILIKRAKHAVYENRRTLKALTELKQGRLAEFGKLMNESHISLRDDYEVTGKELDTLVDAAWQQPGVLGARMTGGGFGGCTIAIVENEQIEQFIDQVGRTYKENIGYAASFYIANIGDGAKEISQDSDVVGCIGGRKSRVYWFSCHLSTD